MENIQQPTQKRIGENLTEVEREKLDRPYIKNYNALNAGGWHATVSRFPHIRYFCTSVTLPGITINNSRYDSPLGSFPTPGVSQSEGSTISFTFNVDEEMENWLQLVRLAIAMTFPRDFAQYQVMFEKDTDHETFYMDVGVTMTDNMQRPLFEIVYKDCLLKSVGDLTLTLMSETPEVVQCTATFDYSYFEVHKLNMAGQPYTLSDVNTELEGPDYNTKGLLFGDNSVKPTWG